MEERQPIRMGDRRRAAKVIARVKERNVAIVGAIHAAVAGLLSILFALWPVCVFAQNLPTPGNTVDGMVSEAMLGLLPAQASIPENGLRERCLSLPVGAPEDRLQSPHGDLVISTKCEVIPDQPLGRLSPTGWTTVRYRWTSVFTAEDPSRGPNAQDTVTEDEVVLFEASTPGQVQAVWHARFDTGPYAIWASVTPEIAKTRDGGTLLSVMSCVNGTGGCGQEFIQRHRDGRWYPVRQDWLDQLPGGFQYRIRHGVRIDPRTLQGEAGFYSEGDPNCCPSQLLVVHLTLRDDSLVLLDQPLIKTAM